MELTKLETEKPISEKAEELFQFIIDKIDETDIPVPVALGVLRLAEHDIVKGSFPDVY